MQSNPNRLSSNPLILRGVWEMKVIHRTPNGRVFHCCDKRYKQPFTCKHGRYFLIKKRWDKSRRDHNATT